MQTRDKTHAIDLGALERLIHVETCALLITSGPRAGYEASFSKDVVRVGAHPRCDFIVEDGTASRFHCELRREERGYMLVDHDSTNGTFVGDLRVREVYLHPGCEFTLGATRVRFTPRAEELRVGQSAQQSCGPLIGASPEMRALYALIDKVAPSDLSVLIEGETGTGKELAAQAIHARSRRAQGPLVVFDCSAVPEQLIESELFGHERGSFSGALKTHRGLFEQAEGGTLFLDELGELALHLQPKLLRALESGVVRRVGGEQPVRVDVRVVCATNRDLRAMVDAGAFRQDLYYRLAKVQVRLPPLRARGEDVGLIAERFVERLNEQNRGIRYLQGIDAEARALLCRWSWPGNVRELRNVIERAYAFAEAAWVRAADLSEHIRCVQERAALAPGGQREAELNFDLPERCSLKEAKERIIATFEREYLLQLLERHQRNISAVAREAGIDRRHVYRLLQKYGVDYLDLA
ncbi:MAG: FHA domain-containing protein [Deltaproteobacteria bacterium]|nr:FHA domain-containing protein [Deltaproteobacteria bacterium]